MNFRESLIKPATHLAILCVDRRNRQVYSVQQSIFANRRDRRIKSPISGIQDIGDFVGDHMRRDR